MYIIDDVAKTSLSAVNSQVDAEEAVWAIKPQYDQAYGFATNLSAVKEDGSFFFIDKSQ